MSLLDKAKQDMQSEHARQGGGWFKFKEGNNKIRLLSEPVAIYEDYKLGMCYTGCGFQGSVKYLAYIYDYADNSIKLMKIPYTIFENIGSLEMNEDYSFTGFPMPYDINIDAKGAGTKEVKYTLTPRPVRNEVPAPTIEELAKKKTVSEVIDILKKKNEEKHREDGTWERIHGGQSAPDEGSVHQKEPGIQYPEEEINPQDIPF